MKLAEKIIEGLVYQNELSIVRKVIRNDNSTLKDVYFALDALYGLISVSYTHLTLPTICSV